MVVVGRIRFFACKVAIWHLGKMCSSSMDLLVYYLECMSISLLFACLESNEVGFILEKKLFFCISLANQFQDLLLLLSLDRFLQLSIFFFFFFFLRLH